MWILDEKGCARMMRRVLLGIWIAALAGFIGPMTAWAAEDTYIVSFSLDDTYFRDTYMEAKAAAYLMGGSDDVCRIYAKLDTAAWEDGECVAGFLRVPEDLEEESYTVFLKLEDEDGDSIQLPGDGGFGVYGNYIGKLSPGDENVDTSDRAAYFDKVIRIYNGSDYVIYSDGAVLTWNLECEEAEFQSGDDGYHLFCEQRSRALWGYRDGMLTYEDEDRTQYLSVGRNNTLRVVRSEESAATWTLEDDRLSTDTGRKTLYLSAEDGEFKLSSRENATKIYKKR